MLIYLAALQNIPEQLYEAASIDGATRGQMTRRITLPLMLPTFFFVLVTQLIAHLQVFGQSYLITGGGPGRESYTSVYLSLPDGLALLPHGVRLGHRHRPRGRHHGDHGRPIPGRGRQDPLLVLRSAP